MKVKNQFSTKEDRQRRWAESKKKKSLNDYSKSKKWINKQTNEIQVKK